MKTAENLLLHFFRERELTTSQREFISVLHEYGEQVKEEAIAIINDPSMRELYVLSGPRCLATVAHRIKTLRLI